MNRSLKTRVLSMILSVVMIVGLLPMNVFATETEGTTPETVIVKFDTNGGIGEYEDQVVTLGSQIVKPETDPTHDSDTFAYWTANLEENEEWNFEENVATDNMTLYATWITPAAQTDPVPTETDPIPTETAPIETDPVETVSTETDPVETDPVETDPVETDPTQVTYTVNHYQQNVSDDEYTLADAQIVEGVAGEITAAAANDYTGFAAKDFEQQTIGEGTVINIYYDRLTYTVTFDSANEGEAPAAQTVRYGALVQKPEDPAYEGYTFVGWMNGEAEYDFSATVTEDITLTAAWEAEIEEQVVYTGGLQLGMTDCDYYNIIESSKYTLVPGATEYQYILNDDNGSRRQVVHVIEVDTKNPNVSVMPGYKNISTETDYTDSSNWGTMTVADQAAYVEENLGKNVIGGMNVSLTWSYVHPYGLLMYEGKVLYDCRKSCDVCGTGSSGHCGGGYLVIKKDGTAELRDPLAPIEEDDWMAQTVCFSYLVRDGKNLAATEDHSSAGAPRSVIGIKADGTLVMMMVDGRMSPYSEGFSNHEMAEIMIALGCVDAINCDGGGSSTFITEREGSGDLSVKSRFSDGAARETLSTLLVLSNVKPDGEFDHASVETENQFVTPGSTVTFTATGVDGSGGPADLPAELTWQLADNSMGTIDENGLFVSNGTAGVAIAQLVYNDKVVGEASVNVVIPESISFSMTNITVPYGKSVELEVVASHGVNTVVLKDGDITLSLSDEKLGTLDGLSFTAGEDTSVTDGTITATFTGTELICETNLILGRASEIIHDFEDGTSGGFETSLASQNGQTFRQYMVTPDTGKVHSGNGAVAVELDLTDVTVPFTGGWMQYYFMNKNVTVDKGVASLGAWIHLPDLEDVEGMSLRIYIKGVQSGNKVSVYPINVGDNLGYDGWRYISADLTSLSEDTTLMVAFQPMINATTTGEASRNAKFTLYFDDITVDYSTAVDDREAPIFEDIGISHHGTDTPITMNGQTIAANTVAFSTRVADDMTKSNYSGLDVSSAKVYIDGVKHTSGVHCTADGRMTIADVTLPDGPHTVRFEISDNMGNKSYMEDYVVLAGGSSAETVTLVPADPNADRLPIGSLYWLNLTASDIETIQSVTTKLNLNSINTWELDHMEVAEGFSASYSLDSVTNNATVTVTRTGDSQLTGEAVLASLPIRTWESDRVKNGEYTAEQIWAEGWVYPMDVKLNADLGKVTFADGASSTFSMVPLAVDTELYSNAAGMGADYSSKTSWHQHTAEAMDDKVATCTENGYTGRTFCEVCNSIVEWGTTENATGHTYAIDETTGLMQCSCGKQYTGIMDGVEYVDGAKIGDGWVENAYYQDGAKLTGIHKVPAPDASGEFYYNFGDDGICENQTKYTGLIHEDDVTYYAILGELKTGWQFVDEQYYYFDETTFAAYTGVKSVSGMEYTFSEDGVLTRGAFVKVADGTKYYWAGKLYASRWIELEEGVYRTDDSGYVAYGNSPVIEVSHQPCTWWHFDEETGLRTGLCDGFIYYQNKLHYCENGKVFYGAVQTTDGLIYCGTSGIVTVNNKCYIGGSLDCTANLEYGYYWCNEDGYIVKDGFVTIDNNTYYFTDYNRAKGFTKIGEDYYFFNAGNGTMMTGTLWVSGSNGYGVTAGYYTFQEDGTMFVPDLVNGKKEIVETDGKLYFTIDGVTMKGGLYELDNEYYYANNSGVLAVNTTIWVSAFNDLINPGNGYFAFDENGKLIKTGFVQGGNGYTYYYNNLVRVKGFTKVGEDFYFFNAGSGAMQCSKYLWVSGSNPYGIKGGTYYFGDDGKMAVS